ncbi:MAG: cation:proton antiporter [Butyricicoccaceae bacterium]
MYSTARSCQSRPSCDRWRLSSFCSRPVSSLNLSDLRQVGRPAVLLSCLPATCELAGYILLAPYLLGVNRIEAAVMGAVLAAVSPAVVVPRMVFLMENRWGTDKSIPQMLLAGASCDDIYVIVLFTTFTGIAQGGNARAADFLNIPVSIVLGIAVGAAAGYALSRFFEAAFARNHMVRGSVKIIIVLSVSFLLVALETVLKGKIALSGLLAVTSMACMLARKRPAKSAHASAKSSESSGSRRSSFCLCSSVPQLISDMYPRPVSQRF